MRNMSCVNVQTTWCYFVCGFVTFFATRGAISKIMHRKMPSKSSEMIGKNTENRAWETIVKVKRYRFELSIVNLYKAYYYT